MRQVVIRDGQAQVVDVPAPARSTGSLLVSNAASAISSGTERSVVSAGSGSLPVRAIRNPDLVARALRYAREHGVKDTVELVRGVTAEDSALGYSSAGTVLDTGGVAEFRVGQRVACAGAGHANHAEIVSVPANLVVAVPDEVSLRDAAFNALGAIALQGVRRAAPTLGERIVVVGLGLLGLITVQILRATGCHVLGVEPVERRRALASELGAEESFEPDDAGEAVSAWTGGFGADAVVVTASSSSSAIVNDAVAMLRRKGRVVPVGDVGLDLQRPGLYEREADVLISTSYGAGRYDASYELGGLDYPLPYVRWTENRNMEEFLRLLARGAVRVDPLVEFEVPVERAPEAYAALSGPSPPLAAVLTYDAEASARTAGAAPARIARSRESTAANGRVAVALVGAGSFVRGTHLPNLQREKDVVVKTVVARHGTKASSLARSLDGAEAATDWQAAVGDPEIDLVLVGTRHDTHAEIAAAALREGKAVFVEKPLGLTREEIDEVWAAGAENDRLAIGFNRPYSSLAQLIGQEVQSGTGPTQLVYRVSAPLPHDNWLNDPREGGGRLLGEACHMFDFANWLCGTPTRVLAAALPPPADVPSIESASVTIEYADGSVATVHYTGVGAGSMPKERVEVFRGGRAWVLDDFRTLTAYGSDGKRTRSLKRQDKGHAALLGKVLAACRGNGGFEPGLAAAYLAQSVALAALDSIASGGPVEVVLPTR